MNLANAREQAAAVKTRHQAARLHNDIDYELAMGEHPPEHDQEGEHALNDLQTRFPGIEDDAGEVTTPPRLSTRAKQNLNHGGRRHTKPAGGQGGGPPAPRRPSSGGGAPAPRRQTSSSGGRNRSSSSGSVRRVVERAAGTTGEDVSDTIITGLQYLLAAGVAYFVIANPKGSGAFSSVLGTIGGGVRKFVAPVDPFASAANTSIQATAPVRPVSTSTAPAASTSAPGTAKAPNMFQDPLAGFPRIKSPLLATGAAGSHVRVPTSPLSLSTGG